MAEKVVPISEKTAPVPLAGIVNHLAWPDATPEPRAWIVDGIIPAGTVTLLQGDGGLGKSLLTMQLIYACATGRPWLGQKTKPCHAFAVYCEDEEVELQRRLWAISTYYRENPDDIPVKDFADLTDLLLASRVGLDSLLMTFENPEGGRGKATDVLFQIEVEAKTHGAELIVLDSLHDLFGGNENNRVQVRQFINALQRISMEHGCAIVVNGHPSMSGMNSQSGTSGSTAWSNSVRSRLYLAKEKAHPEEKPPFTGPLLLRIMKANYAAVGTQIELEWINGVMIPKNLQASTQSNRDKKSNCERAFMDCVELAYKQNRPPRYASNAKFSVGKMFPEMPCAQGFKKADFQSAMERLINDGKIEVITRYDQETRNEVRLIIPKKQTIWDEIPDET